jgi:glycosyltransferase involved in cell wall biosynthesis
VLASRINGIPEFVSHEENGLLFSPGNLSELASCMRRIFSDEVLRDKLGRGARRTAETVLSPMVWRNKINSVIEEAVSLHSDQNQ